MSPDQPATLEQIQQLYFKAGDAAAELGMTRDQFNHYVKAGLITGHKILGSHRYFLKSDVRKMGETLAEAVRAAEDRDRNLSNKPVTRDMLEAETEQVFEEVKERASDMDATFALATPEDMDAVYDLALRIFGPTTISADRRREWLAREPRGNYIVKKKDGSVVAYLYLQPMKHDRLIPYMNSEIKNRDLTPDDIEPFVPGQPAEVRVGGIGSDPRVDPKLRTAYTAMLLRGVRADLAQLAQQGIVISHLYGSSERFDGIAMSLHLGMRQYTEPKRGRFTFVLDVQESPAFLLQPYKKAIAQWRTKHQQQTK